MTNALFAAPVAKTRRTPPLPTTSLRINSSANGVARPFGYGQTRVSGNLIWYGDFEATPVFSSPASGGKGGGSSGGASVTGYSYSASFAFGLAEGPISAIIQAWQNKSPISFGAGVGELKDGTGPVTASGFTLFDGGYQQLPWAWLQSFQASAAQNFRGLAYVAAQGLALGDSPELPNMTFEVRFADTGAVVETANVPASAPYAVPPAYFDYDYGIAVHLVVPAASPYQLNGSNGTTDATSVSGLAAAIGGSGGAWGSSNSSGVVWDVGATGGRVAGTPLTKVASSPGPGQFSFAVASGWTFNVTDAGQPVAIIEAALSPGVFYCETTSGNISAGSSSVTALGAMTGVVAGARVLGPSTIIPPYTFVSGVSGGSATGNASSGSNILIAAFGSYAASLGTALTDSAGVFAPGTTLVGVTPSSIAVTGLAATSAIADAIIVTGTFTGSLADNQITNCSPLPPPNAIVSDPGSYAIMATVVSSSGTTATLGTSTGLFGSAEPWNVTIQFTGDVTAGSGNIVNPSINVADISPGWGVSDSAGAWSYLGSAAVFSVTPGSITLSNTAGSNAASDVLTFARQVTLSNPATASATGVSLTFIGEELTQVLSSPSEGEFSLSVTSPSSFGSYSFSSSDAGKSIVILDSPDANPADVLQDFLTNPHYGLTQFPVARLGDLSTYRNYCQAAGLFVSPVVSTQSEANSFLQDLMTATNSEIVWSAGVLTVAPYGDIALSANGATYTPPSQPVYSLADDDFMAANQATNPHSVAASNSPDPVIVTRIDIADQNNDIRIEYLDRANSYNPTIVEAKDDAAISLFGVKSSASKQLHLFCDQKAALSSAQLMLGRQQVLRSFAFTLGREYILLDPMDIVAITDATAGLSGQWVRIKEITENDDRTLSITAEEYLEGTGAAPIYQHARPAGYVPNYNIPAPDALTPIMFDAPVQLGNVLGMESILCTNGSGPNWGGCDIWLSQDNQTFKFAGTLRGGTTMGTLSANFASGSDPDTANSLAVNLTESEGTLLPGTLADADHGNTLCLVDNELVTYEQATLTAQYNYNLGRNGAAPGYLRRGFYGTTIAAHSAGASFARLREGSYFTIGYDSADIGQTIYVKLLSFNQYGGGRQTLDQVASHAHTLAAPPVTSSGLLPGLIQTPDMALDAATAQLTVSAAGPITLPASPSNATLVSGTLTTTGQLVQVAYNAQFTNSSSSAVTIVWRVTYQGVVVLDSAGITVNPGATATVAKQTTYTPGAQSGVFAFIADMVSAVSPTPTASYVDLSATELRR